MDSADGGEPVAQYHVSIDGQGYILDLDRYAKRIREPFATKQSSGSFALADLRGPEQVLVISDWSGGEGALQHEEGERRYRSGDRVDGYSLTGSLRLGPYGVAYGTGIESFLMMQPYGNTLYVATGPLSGTPRVFVWDGASLPLSFTAAAGRIPTSMAVYVNRLYVGNSGDGTVASFDGTTWTAVAFTLAAGKASALATHYRQAQQYLYVASAGGGVNGACRMVFWDGSSVSLGQFDLEEPGCDVLVPWRHQLWVFSADADRRLGGVYSVDDSTSGGVWETHHLLIGNYFTAGCVFGDAIYLGCGLDGEVYRWDGTNLDLVFRLSKRDQPYTAIIRGMAVWDGALWLAVVDGVGSTGLVRYDPSLGSSGPSSGQASLTRPVRGLSGSTPGYLAVYQGKLSVTTTLTGGVGTVNHVNPSVYGAAGQIESGLISCGLPGISKLFKSVTIVTSSMVSPQSVQVEYRLEDTGNWQILGTLSTVGATSATYAFAANTTGRQIAFRVTLGGTAGAGTSPVLYELALRYVPRPAVAREWELAVVLEGTPELPLVTLDGAPDPLTGAQLTSALWTAAGSAGPVTLVDLDGSSYSVYVQDVREEIGKISQRRGYQRLGLVKLVEAA